MSKPKVKAAASSLLLPAAFAFCSCFLLVLSACAHAFAAQLSAAAGVIAKNFSRLGWPT